MEEIIKQFCGVSELVELYTDKNNTDSYEVGYVVAYSDNMFMVHSYHPRGVDDGFFVQRIEDLYCVSYGTQYCEKIFKLIAHQAETAKQPMLEGFQTSGNMMYDVLNECMYNQQIVCVVLYNEYEVFGRVKNVNLNTFEIEIVKGDGTFDGFTILRWEDVRVVSVDGVLENERTYLVER